MNLYNLSVRLVFFYAGTDRPGNGGIAAFPHFYWRLIIYIITRIARAVAPGMPHYVTQRENKSPAESLKLKMIFL